MVHNLPPHLTIPKTKEVASLDHQIEVLERIYLDVSFKIDNPDPEIVEACRKVVEYLYQERRALNGTKQGVNHVI